MSRLRSLQAKAVFLHRGISFGVPGANANDRERCYTYTYSTIINVRVHRDNKRYSVCTYE